MSTIAHTHRPDGKRLKTLFAAITELFNGLSDGLEMAREYQSLSRLTPTELAQLGIARADIPRVVARRLLND
jgi:uncharacterized protein YjiS (DUF1127 family)